MSLRDQLALHSKSLFRGWSLKLATKHRTCSSTVEHENNFECLRTGERPERKTEDTFAWGIEKKFILRLRGNQIQWFFAKWPVIWPAFSKIKRSVHRKRLILHVMFTLRSNGSPADRRTATKKSHLHRYFRPFPGWIIFKCETAESIHRGSHQKLSEEKKTSFISSTLDLLASLRWAVVPCISSLAPVFLRPCTCTVMIRHFCQHPELWTTWHLMTF